MTAKTGNGKGKGNGKCKFNDSGKSSGNQSLRPWSK
jgi:hypothetical protein